MSVAAGGLSGWRAQAELPAAVVLDLMVPDMDGFEVLERLRANARTQHVPAVMFTGKELTPPERRWLTERSATLLRKAPHVSEDDLAALQRAVPLGGAEAARATAHSACRSSPGRHCNIIETSRALAPARGLHRLAYS